MKINEYREEDWVAPPEGTARSELPVTPIVVLSQELRRKHLREFILEESFDQATNLHQCVLKFETRTTLGDIRQNSVTTFHTGRVNAVQNAALQALNTLNVVQVRKERTVFEQSNSVVGSQPSTPIAHDAANAIAPLVYDSRPLAPGQSIFD